MQFLSRHLFPWRTARVRVLDREGAPVSGAEVVVAGLSRSRTNSQGSAKFYLPADDWYALVIRYGNHEEVLYQEKLAPGGRYFYRQDPSLPAGRICALSGE